ncbi:hypothetical protein ACFW1M_35915 [Streptomyces inhibens]|uniref:hypothetical protein n=1 Tax=Streptomyces inhibens TaxID=2293571 RepID=UPI0036B3CC50
MTKSPSSSLLVGNALGRHAAFASLSAAALAAGLLLTPRLPCPTAPAGMNNHTGREPLLRTASVTVGLALKPPSLLSMRIDHIGPWLHEHGAAPQPMLLSARFDAYLSALPWAGSGIDWRDLPHRSLALDGISDDEVVEWARQTPLALHAHVLVIDSAAEPGVLCRFEDAMRDFELLSNRPELYMCGVDLVNGDVHPVFDRFIERRSFMNLNARI